MPFIVGIAMMGAGALMLWGAISGRLAKILAAVFSPHSLTSATTTSDTSQFQQLNLPTVAVV